MGKRLEICCDYELKDGSGSEARWCAGELIAVSDGTNIIKIGAVTAKYKKGEAVMMRWDADPTRRATGGGVSCLVTESVQPASYLPSLWNPRAVQQAGAQDGKVAVCRPVCRKWFVASALALRAACR